MQLVTCGSESMGPVSMSRVVLWRARRLERQYLIASWADAELRHQAGRRQGTRGHLEQGQQGAGIGEGEINLIFCIFCKNS